MCIILETFVYSKTYACFEKQAKNDFKHVNAKLFMKEVQPLKKIIKIRECDKKVG